MSVAGEGIAVRHVEFDDYLQDLAGVCVVGLPLPSILIAYGYSHDYICLFT